MKYYNFRIILNLLFMPKLYNHKFLGLALNKLVISSALILVAIRIGTYKHLPFNFFHN